MAKKIIAAFKTHFDFGYTDTAENVLRHYCTDVLQSALDVCERSQALGENLQYRWTLPSFLLMQMYEKSGGETRERLNSLVQRGQIVCHALPFTMHTSLLDERMLQKMFVFTDEYCQTFGKAFPIAAKMTDVPGHMSAIIKPLVSRGVRFLHLGKNPASSAPKVPLLFWWEDLQGNRILTLYSGDYGTNILPPKEWKFPVWLAMLQTGDNVGVQSVEFITESAQAVSGKSEFVTGTLDDFAREIMQCDLSDLPVIRGELSDTWIHGAGTYPGAMSVYKRSLRRFQSAEERAKKRGIGFSELSDMFYKTALIFAEHTFGVNVLKFLGKARKYDKDSLARERRENPQYAIAEKSWREQEAYAARLKEICDRAECLVGIEERPSETNLLFTVRARGNSLDVLLPGGKRITLGYEYIVFGQADIHRFMKEYLVRFWEWSLSDYGRYGYPPSERKTYRSRIGKVEKTGSGYSAEFLQDGESCREYGNFRSVKINLSLTEHGLHIRFGGMGKEATPMAEAGNFLISLNRRGERFTVLQGNQEVDVRRDIIPGANHNLWAVSECAAIDDTRLHTYDAPLVSFGRNGICKYWDVPLRSSKAEFVVNLFNNHWGTNFPQWIEGDYSFEFLLQETELLQG